MSTDKYGRSESLAALLGGAGNSARPDIELDPWVGLIVDHRVEYPVPIAITEEPEPEPRTDDDMGATMVQEPIDLTGRNGFIDTPQASALVAAINITPLTIRPSMTGQHERPALDIAVDLLEILAGQGWRLIHD